MTAEPLEDQLQDHEDSPGAVRWGGVLVGLIILAYLPVFSAGFIWQDDAQLTLNSVLRGERISQVWRDPSVTPKFAPLTYSLLFAEHHVLGDEPAGYHVVSLILHLINALLLWTLLRRLEVPGAFLAAAVAALHPAQATAVAWVAQIGVLLSAGAFLVALLGYLRWNEIIPKIEELEDRRARLGLPQRPWLRYTVVVLIATAAMLCDPVAATFPAAVMLIIWWKRGALRPADLWPLVPFFVLSIAVIACSVWPDVAAHRLGAVLRGVPGAGPQAMVSLVKLIVPIPPVVDFLHAPDSLGIGAQVGLLVIVVMSALVLMAMRRTIGAAPAAVGMFFVLCIILNALLQRQRGPGMPSDDVQYLACIAPLILMGAAFWRIIETVQSSGRGRLVTLIVVPVAFAAMTLLSARRFVDEKTFWQSSAGDDVSEAFGHYRLGIVAVRGGDVAQAAREFQFAVWTDPGNVPAINGLARVLEAQRRFDEADAVYDAALRKSPNSARLLMGLASYESRLGRQEQAIEHYSKAAGLEPEDAVVQHNLGTALARAGRSDEALAHYRKAIELEPHVAAAHVSLATLLFARGEFQEAASELHVAVQIDPMNFDAYMSSGAILAQLKQWPLAERSYRDAVTIRPDSLDAWTALAAMVKNQGRDSEAAYIAHRIDELKSKPAQSAPSTQPHNIDQLLQE